MLTVLTQRVTFLSCRWEESHRQALPDLQTFLWRLGIEITFSREGRIGTRMIRVTTSAENTDGTVVLLCKKFTRCGCHEHRGAILIRINSEAGIWDCCRATEDVAKLR